MNGPGIRVDDSSYIGPNCFFEAEHGGTIHIDQAVDVGPGCIFLTTTHAHGPSWRRAGRLEARDVVIGPGAWLGARVTALPGTRVGRGCIVGANTLLNGEYPPSTVIVGTPGRVVRTIEDS
jgi:maltose O-acetyltransferase